jgi:GyrI-like small molecule binding domain
MDYKVEAIHAPAQRISVVSTRATMLNLPIQIRAAFDRFYSNFKSHGELNICYYPQVTPGGEFEVRCGVQVESGGNDATPGGAVATTFHMGPYTELRHAHQAIHKWVRENGYQFAGPSWEVYGHWSDDPAQLRTDVFYLLSQ